MAKSETPIITVVGSNLFNPVLELLNDTKVNITCSNATGNGGAEIISTADHGNVEMMQDDENNQPHSQHTTNLVPLLYIGRNADMAKTGSLSDIAPSLLQMMGLPQPAEMTGHSLVSIK